MNLAFGKSLRLLNSSDFQCVFDDAPFRASHQHFLVLARFNNLAQGRIGLVIAKKHLSLAVQRNRIKRQLREEFRHQQQAFAGIDVIVLSRKGLVDLTNSDFRQQLRQQWQRVLKKARQAQRAIEEQSATEANNAETNNQ